MDVGFLGFMHLFAPPRNFDPAHPELMDRPGTDEQLLREELQLLEGANRRLGGQQLILEYVRRFHRSRRSRSLSILDLGTGMADIPRAIVAWARQAGVNLSITAVDLNPGVMRVAREWCQEWPVIKLEQHDLRALPYPPASFDMVLCSLVLHHFARKDAIEILRRIGELARETYVVNDLRRNWAAIWTVELLARIVIKSQIVRHDGPQSIRAAFTRAEWESMAREAGLNNFRIRYHHMIFRMVLAGLK